jgi:1-deoxy-D-xylulose-5-phosphate reductoisomerase
MARKLAVLGSTGSIGRQTLDVVRASAGRVRVTGLATGANEVLLAEQAAEFHPRVVVLAGRVPSAELFPDSDRLTGPTGLADMVTRPDVDLVVVGSSGAAGLVPTLAALRAGKLVALANKETLVMAGPLIRAQLRESGELVPIDSEHSAIWQCLQGEPERAVEKLIITASGGALRSLAVSELAAVTPDQALRHPTWSMGRKITIDSANLMNKGLEVLEAQWLFDLGLDHIDVILHPQSIVHSLVTFADGSVKAQLGLPDMRLPIQYALSHPERWPSALPRLDLAESRLTFAPVDWARYPALSLALEAGRNGGTYPAVLSAADEIAVEAFLDHRIRFTDIPAIVGAVLDRHNSCEVPELDDILGADGWARVTAAGLIGST